MASYNKFRIFVQDVAHKEHDLETDQLVVALCAAANAPVNTNSVLTDLTQISYTNCSTRNITTSTSAHTAGTYKLTLTDLVLTASGGTVGPFRYVVVYNDTSTSDKLIAWADYGSDITLASGETFTIDFDGSGGFLTIA